jgi:hypothetical protein
MIGTLTCLILGLGLLVVAGFVGAVKPPTSMALFGPRPGHPFDAVSARSDAAATPNVK